MPTIQIELEDIRPVSVAFKANELVVGLADGRRIATPLTWYPTLAAASEADRAKLELMPMGIHWPTLDEDLSVIGMLKGSPATAITPRP